MAGWWTKVLGWIARERVSATEMLSKALRVALLGARGLRGANMRFWT